ncbi:MAG: hypothetical protein SFY80_11600 [Verrucomicrobiota bacterium]|nr:hypothetical protein [Verrucomicrobiota bacterium]
MNSGSKLPTNINTLASTDNASSEVRPQGKPEFSTVVIHLRPIGNYDCELTVERVEFAARTRLFITHIPVPHRVMLESCIL